MKSIALLLICFVCLSEALFAESGLQISGSLKSDTILSADITNATVTNFPVYAGMDTLRIRALNKKRKNVKFEAMFDFYMYHGEFADLYNTTMSAPSLFNAAVSAEIIKLYLKIKPSFGDITLGRQIVRFGQGFIFSPIDLFSQRDLSDIAFSRKGSDIIRVEIPLSDTGKIEALSTLSTHFTNIDSALKISLNIGGWDTSVVAMYRYSDYETIAGFAFKGDLILGWHGEAVLHILNNGKDVFPEAVVGADYSFFDGNLILMAEYYYNGRSVDVSKLTPSNIASVKRTWFAEDYAFFRVQYLIDEISGVSANTIFNFSDNAGITSLQYNRSLFQNFNMTTWLRWYLKNINGVVWLERHDLEAGVRLELRF